MSKFTSENRARGLCDRCGFTLPLRELRLLTIRTKRVALRVCRRCWEEDHPQLKQGMYPVADVQAVRAPRPDFSGYPASRAVIVAVSSYLSGVERTFATGQVGNIFFPDAVDVTVLLLGVGATSLVSSGSSVITTADIFAVGNQANSALGAVTPVIGAGVQVTGVQGTSVTGNDPYYSDDILLLHMDGSNGSTSFPDNSPTPNSITRVGTPTISSSIVKYGSGSGVFNGTSDYLRISPVSAFDFNTENFTIEAWIYPTQLGTQNRYIFSITESLVGNFAYTYFGVLANGTLTAWVQPTTGGGGSAVASGAGAISTNTWTYVTLTRQGTSAFIFINGVLVNQTSSWLTYPSAKVQFVAVGAIANGYTDSTVGRFSGYIDEVRITKGVARYTANFTPPTAAFVNGMNITTA